MPPDPREADSFPGMTEEQAAYEVLADPTRSRNLSLHNLATRLAGFEEAHGGF